jgi:hypothetical protein
LRNAYTKELVEEFEASNCSDGQICPSAVTTSRGGRNKGTFVHELLALNYAGWISPRFQLEVNRVFLESRKPKQPPVLECKIDKHSTLNDLIYELAQIRGVSTEQIRIHYNQAFNSTNWMDENTAFSAAAKLHLRDDLKKELAEATPELIQLRQQAKQLGYRLVVENDFMALQGRLQMQQQDIEKAIDALMGISRNNRQLSTGTMWG